MRNWAWWRHFRNYFPLSLEKTVDLEPSRNYLFCVYPHGLLCSGAFGNFATNHSDFSRLFPGLKPYLLTINAAFNMPFTRELLLGLGEYILRNYCNNVECLFKIITDWSRLNLLNILIKWILMRKSIYCKLFRFKLKTTFSTKQNNLYCSRYDKRVIIIKHKN